MFTGVMPLCDVPRAAYDSSAMPERSTDKIPNHVPVSDDNFYALRLMKIRLTDRQLSLGEVAHVRPRHAHGDPARAAGRS